MKKLIIIFSTTVVLFFAGYIYYLSLNKPIGIKPEILFNAKLAKHWQFPDNLLKDSLFLKNGYFILSLEPQKYNNNFADKSIDLYIFESNSQALQEYISNKKKLIDSVKYKLYREDGKGSNMCFVLYKSLTHINKNHGIPLGIYVEPNIKIGFLKNNIYINMSYFSFTDNHNEYIDEINSDIEYTSKYLEK